MHQSRCAVVGRRGDLRGDLLALDRERDGGLRRRRPDRRWRGDKDNQDRKQGQAAMEQTECACFHDFHSLNRTLARRW